MDKLTKYREAIKDIITKYSKFKPSVGDVEVEVIFDESNEHYELVYSGWNRKYRIHGPVLHLDIRNGKVYIQHDGTEEGIADELVDAGIPKEDIVLAFKHPDIRKHTGYATA